MPGTTELYPVGAEAYTPKQRKNPRPDDIFVKSHTIGGDEQANRIRFDCCPPRVLQAHNVFGHSSIRDYAFELFQRQTGKRGVVPTGEEMDWWASGRGLELSHLHITGNFAIEPGHKTSVFDAVDANNREGKHRDAASCIRLGFLPDGRHSQQHTATLYDKHCLLAAEWKNPGPLQQQLLALTRQSIRLEFKIYSDWLRTYGVDEGGRIVNLLLARRKDPMSARMIRSLHFVKNWDYVDLDGLFFDLLAKYNITNAIQPLLTEHELDILSRSERTAYTLWLRGERLEDHYRRTAIHTLTRAVLDKTGISMKARRRPVALPPLDLGKVFTPENLLRTPDWLAGSNRYWTP